MGIRSTSSNIEALKSQTRAAFDIGSGITKIVVADVNLLDKKISRVHYNTFKYIDLHEDMTKNHGEFASEIENKLIHTILNMKAEIKKRCSSDVKYYAIGTSVFRKAKNAQTVLQHVKERTGLEINLTLQDEEGEIAFLSASAVTNLSQNEVISLDIGTGSTQISGLVNGQLEIYGTEFGGNTAELLMHQLRKEPLNRALNPLLKDEVEPWVEQIKTHLGSAPDWIHDSNKKIIGIGSKDTFAGFMAKALGTPTFTKEQVMTVILENCHKSDEDFPSNICSSIFMIDLVLLYAIMDHFNISEITHGLTNGGCEGMLVMDQYWGAPNTK